ncbi:MAG: uracil-DNA glycosylase [Candidatus Gastranaerophilales bacterium]|nr:uracil-DNA glycosylase [Candidatus Gastranaerophilales bacterium]
MQYLNFNEQELTPELKQKSINQILKVCNQCYSCPLGKTRDNLVFSDGNPNAKIMLIGEAPGAEEDASGTPFVGRAGRLLNDLLQECNIDRNKDLYICNTVKCRPPENRVPTDEEKQTCSSFLSAQINIVRPKVIVLCGATAAKTFLGDKIKISQIRGQWSTLFGNIKSIAIFHPSYLLRNHSLEENSPRWLTKQDLIEIKKVAYSNN